jgi:hypothetical protein
MSKQWEYAVLRGDEGNEIGQGTLNCRGSVGWELVSVDRGIAYMKREMKAESQEPIFPTINDPWASGAVKMALARAEAMQ